MGLHRVAQRYFLPCCRIVNHLWNCALTSELFDGGKKVQVPRQLNVFIFYVGPAEGISCLLAEAATSRGEYDEPSLLASVHAVAADSIN